MSSHRIARPIALISLLMAVSAVTLTIASQAVATTKAPAHKKTTVSTGAATHILNTSALLTGAVTPNGAETSYYFQYGTSIAYGSQTPTVNVGSGSTKVKVGQSISGLQVGLTYHFRIVGVSSAGAIFLGHDHIFLVGKHILKFEITKSQTVLAGTPFLLSGTLAGVGGANHTIVLQASPYPYTEAFKTIAAPGVTDAKGRFSFRVSSISSSTAFRVITLDPRPVYSLTMTVRAAARVVLHVRSSKIPGLVRLYGTVTPAAAGATVFFQVHKTVKPGPLKPGATTTGKFISQFATIIRRDGRAFSRFSLVVNVRIGGRYRAYVKLPPGMLVSGYSPTVVLRAGPATHKPKKKG
jgi:hypothetical protein